MKLRHPARKINSQHDSNSLSIKNLQQCPVWCVPSPLFFALAFSSFHQHIRNELYEFSLFKENEWPRKGSKRGSSYVYAHVGCVTYLFMPLVQVCTPLASEDYMLHVQFAMHRHLSGKLNVFVYYQLITSIQCQVTITD